MLEWAGERFIPGVKGDVEIEQLHRYHAASDLVRGLRVLDLACGEGDGSAILAGGAGSVVGVDLRPEAVAHARATHPSPRLRFEVGSAEQIPLKDASVDAVVCFETLEHVAAHDQVLAEFRRVLQPGGFLVISCPDRREHSEVTQSRNPLHLRSLYLNEFRDLLGRHFRNVQLYGQRVQYASMLAPLDDHQASFVSFRSDGSAVVRGQGVVSPVHFLAVASDGPCPPLPAGVLTPQAPPFRAELESLRGALATSQADLARLGARLSEQEEQFRRREQEVRKLGAAGLSAQEARLNATALELRQAARALDSERKAVADLQQQAQDLDAKLRVVWASRSWRLTAPLRKAMSGVRAIRPRRRLRRASEAPLHLHLSASPIRKLHPGPPPQRPLPRLPLGIRPYRIVPGPRAASSARGCERGLQLGDRPGARTPGNAGPTPASGCRRRLGVGGRCRTPPAHLGRRDAAPRRAAGGAMRADLA